MAPIIVQSTFLLLLFVLRLDIVTAIAHSLLDKRGLVTPNKLPGNWTFDGCYTDNVDGGRTLTDATYTNTTGMTDESCIAFCITGGFIFAGAEYAQECYCGNYLAPASSLATATDCSMACTGNSSEQCGGPNRLSLFWNGTQPSPPVANPGAGLWSLLGCYTDSGARTLTTGIGVPGGAANMSVDLCTSACQTAGYILAGVEYAAQCYCGNVFSNGGGPAPDGFTGCNMPCNGNQSEYCGGANRLDLYDFNNTVKASSSSSSSSTTSVLSTSSTLSSSSLKSSSSSSSTLSSLTSTSSTSSSSTLSTSITSSSTLHSSTSSSSVSSSSTLHSSTSSSSISSSSTLHSSTSSSSVSSSTLHSSTSSSSISSSSTLDPSTSSSSVSSSSTLHSSTSTSSISSSSTLDPSTSSSSTSPSASASAIAGWFALGCYTDTVQVRTLSFGVPVPGGGANMTVENCLAACSAGGYKLAGVEYASQCYCDNVLENGAGPAPDGNALCDMACSGNAQETCGGPNRLDLYSFGGSSIPTGTSPSTVATSTASVTTSVTATGTGSATSLPSGWTYRGCYNDNINGRIVRYEQPDNPALTIESCTQLCAGLGYSIAGLEYSVQCFCDDYIVDGGTLTANADCAMTCGGSSTEICGGPNLMSIYAIGSLVVYAVPVPQTLGLPGSWTYGGCLTDNVNNLRTFPYENILMDNNTATNCLSLCAEYGYMAGGMEFAYQCFCGDFSDIASSGATIVADAECSTSCSGNASFFCGGDNLLSYYSWTGPPLYNWNFPTGTSQGQYEFLIGGVVVPLLVTHGVNGKVSFLEKWGTGPPNSTGAYELDLAEINNFTAAWRPMHVLTDVFCSAGLVLPDKVGRQINVGGWSDSSTYGIRLYWPDGSPGVWGTNDWQENVNELSLQIGRWYPSAMVMANGSILIVGGENGSNGPPQPSLEILPNPVGGAYVTCDYLQRTDPYNLYPFLAVLPTGGILIAYYNEARILDPVTFATTKTLPNIPGAVNNFLGGRTYPLEGTAVLFPQYPPYTAPLTVLICGGSTPFAAVALDNCVTIQPEVADPVWTIERMPSQRVIPCIAALPDGTYLILNGAQEGVAGFGLANDPNLDAVLYDPTKPLNSRMSVMASTIVARMYHSEATLLQDGRVLVSGSDPEDPNYPQEYRVEVFLPPYLLSGLARPSYTIQNTDWAYGESVQIVVTGGAATVVSLIGAQSSTHGNAMGQRTIFPAFSCAGSTCTITAPPNVNVSPPGWFMLFILNGPTPSIATWVRIGGDPAELGNWPDFPDFSVPGL